MGKRVGGDSAKVPKGAKILDAYGGSGLCSHIFKRVRPDLQVWCNDSDDYHSEILPQADKVRAWWERWHDKPALAENEQKSLKALSQSIGADLAQKIIKNFTGVAATNRDTVGHKAWGGLMRKTYADLDDIDDYCRGVRFFCKIWGPSEPIPTSYALLILDPPYNTVKALDSTRYGTRRDDPPLSLWAAQEAFKSATPAICWGRDGWLVDYPGGAVLAEKHASRGHNTEWLKGNAAFVRKYGRHI